MINKKTIVKIAKEKHHTDASCYNNRELIRFMGLYPDSFKELISVDKQ